MRARYRLVYQYPDNGYPNANAIWHDVPTTLRLARIGMTYRKRLQHKEPEHEKGTFWIERFDNGVWVKQIRPTVSFFP